MLRTDFIILQSTWFVMGPIGGLSITNPPFFYKCIINS